jgi:hypothetical protein
VGEEEKLAALGEEEEDERTAVHHAPYTLHPTPCTLHSTPHTLHPTPYTLHPTPHTHRGSRHPLHHICSITSCITNHPPLRLP